MQTIRESSHELSHLIARFAPSDVPLLVVGKEGSAKRRVAELIHSLSPFREGPFVAVDCAAWPEMKLAVELFGREPEVRGDFPELVTGAVERAGGGTLFLDHVETAPKWIRKRLLHMLEHRTVERLGSAASLPARLRFIAATSVDRAEPEAWGSDERALLDRLAGGYVLRVPSLRQPSASLIPRRV